jgi:beta-galactosidase
VDRIAQDPGYTKPYYLCEYAHAMSNSMGSIGDYNDLFDKYDTLMGGAIWEWQDQALWNRRDPARPFLAYGGGFGEVPNDGVFILKGVVFADRQRTPKYAEAKKAYQWVTLTAGDLADGQVQVRNRYAFLNLSRFEAAFEVTRDGTVIQEGRLPRLDVPAGQTGALTVPLQPITPEPGAAPGTEYFLRVSLSLARDEVWAPAGYEIASEQFALPAVAPAAPASGDLAALTAQETDAALTVTGAGFQVVFSKADGTLAELTYGGRNLLRPGGGPRLLAYRAPHLNDDLWAAGGWRGVGLNALEPRLLGLTWTQVAPGVVQVSVSTDCAGKGDFGISQALTYTVSGDGAVAVDTALVPRGPRVVVPRLGARLLLDPALDHFTWLGRGPAETYSDRKRGSDVGLYTTTVAEQLTPYVRPMECGNHEDVRWAAVTDGAGAGLIVTCEGGLMQASALPYADEQLEAAAYPRDLPASEASVLCLSARTLGVGSGGCGPRPLDQYITYSDPVTFSYTLRPAPGGLGQLPRLARAATPVGRVAPVLAARSEQTGKVALTCATPDVALEYSLDGGVWQPYTEPLTVTRETLLGFRASAPGLLPFTGQALFPRIVDRSKWQVISASSYEPGEGELAHIIDGNPGTFWHSRWSANAAKHPHEFVIDFGVPLALSGVVYQGRQEMVNGRVGDYEIYLSNDPQNWGEPALKGRFANSTERQTARLPQPVTARYLRFVALNEVTGQAFASVAEITIIPAE